MVRDPGDNTVKDFVPIHSLLRKTTHVHPSCWPLRGG
jgi:hypothetical protein